jgi:hypothetical protein
MELLIFKFPRKHAHTHAFTHAQHFHYDCEERVMTSRYSNEDVIGLPPRCRYSQNDPLK